jgi:hypothetical protein
MPSALAGAPSLGHTNATKVPAEAGTSSTRVLGGTDKREPPVSTSLARGKANSLAPRTPLRRTILRMYSTDRNHAVANTA